MCDSENNTVESFILPPEQPLYGPTFDDKKEPFKPIGGDSLVSFVKNRIHKLTDDEIKNRTEQGLYTTLTCDDVAYPAYINDCAECDYVYIPRNSYFRSALAYAMAKVYGMTEKPNKYDVLIDGYEGFILKEDL
jgi:hypothetical protein